LVDPVARHARERPGALAVRAAGRDLTYAELDAEVEREARRLADEGFGPGSRIATTLPAGIELAALLHAAPRVGAALVPLAPGLPAPERERLRAVANASDPSARESGAPAERNGPAPDRAGRGGAVARDLPRTSLDPSALHTVLFTSGTSGAPKPVELTYANHLARVGAPLVPEVKRTVWSALGSS
jgi:acyl-CoA synthetase (AMP-forming)/AMP-acid ligase II